MKKPESEQIESDIESYLFSQCKKHNIMCIKQTGLNGIPDRELVGYGLSLYVETKRPDEDQREDQKAIADKLKRRGRIVLVIDKKSQIDELMLDFNKAEKNFKRRMKRKRDKDDQTPRC